jgi:hypothetical protein
VSGNVSAQFVQMPSTAVIIVSRYSGVDPDVPFGSMLSGNTLGLSGACDGGTDNTAFSFPFTTTHNGSVVFAAVAIRHKEFTPGLDWTQRDLLQVGTSGDRSGAAVMDQSVANIGSIDLDGTFNEPLDWAVIGIEIRSAPPQTTDAPDLPITPDAAVREASIRILDGGTGERPSLIEISLPKPTTLHVTLHDVRGRRLARVWDGNLPAGRHQLEWALTPGHEKRAAGIYFLRADLGDRVVAHKFLLLR